MPVLHGSSAPLCVSLHCLGVVVQGDGSYEIVTDLVLNDALVAKIKKVRDSSGTVVLCVLLRTGSTVLVHSVLAASR